MKRDYFEGDRNYVVYLDVYDSLGKISTLYFHFVVQFLLVCLFVFGATAPQWARASSFTRFLDHTQRLTTIGRAPLDE